MMKRFTLLLICFLCGSFLNGQDIHFSQYYMAPLTQNPAMAGALNNAEAYMNYKNQWKVVTSPYKTYAVSYIHEFTMYPNIKTVTENHKSAGRFYNNHSSKRICFFIEVSIIFFMFYISTFKLFIILILFSNLFF